MRGRGRDRVKVCGGRGERVRGEKGSGETKQNPTFAELSRLDCISL